MPLPCRFLKRRNCLRRRDLVQGDFFFQSRKQLLGVGAL
jgi:hypothetical protein